MESELPPDEQTAPGSLRSVLMPGRGLIAASVATAALWVGVLVTTGGGATPGTTAGGAPPAAASVPLTDADAKADAVLVYFEKHPDELERGRMLVAESLAASPSAAYKAHLEAALQRMDARLAAEADALLAEKKAAAGALREKGDLDGMTRALTNWPEAYRASPQAKEALTLAETWRTEALAPGAAILRDGQDLLAKWESLGSHVVDDARDLLARVAAYGRAQEGDAAQRSLVEALRAKVAAQIESSLRALRGPAAITALVQALAKAKANDPDGARAALERLARDEAGGSEVGDLIAEVVGKGKEVEKALTARLAHLAKGNWAAILDGQLFAGPVADAPAPRAVFAPGWTVPSGGGAPVPYFSDLFAVEPDRERAASWLVLSGLPAAALQIAPANGRARSLLVVGAAASAEMAPPAAGAWADLLRQIPSLLRVGAGGGAQPPAPKPSAATATALAAVLAGDWVRAWKSLEEVLPTASADAEVAILRSRVLEALSRPLPTLGSSLLSLAEARRAWDLAPSLPDAPRAMAEASLRFFKRHPGMLAEALRPAALVACEEAARLGPVDASILVYAGERRLTEGKAKDALPLIRRAAHEAPDDANVALLLARVEDAAGDPRKALQALEHARKILGPDFPEWAQTMLEHLTRR